MWTVIFPAAQTKRVDRVESRREQIMDENNWDETQNKNKNKETQHYSNKQTSGWSPAPFLSTTSAEKFPWYSSAFIRARNTSSSNVHFCTLVRLFHSTNLPVKHSVIVNLGISGLHLVWSVSNLDRENANDHIDCDGDADEGDADHHSW